MKPVWMLTLGALVLFAGFAVAAPGDDEDKVVEVEAGEIVIVKEAPKVKKGTSISFAGGGDWSSLDPETKKMILEQLKKELPPEALREALRALAGKPGPGAAARTFRVGTVPGWFVAPGGEGCKCACTCGKARIDRDVIIEVNGKRIHPGEGQVRIRRHAVSAPPMPPMPPSAGRIRLGGTAPAPHAARGHDGALLGAIRALTREISALRREVRQLRGTHAGQPGQIMVPGHPHPFPRLEIEIEDLKGGMDGEDGKGGGVVIFRDGQPLHAGLVAVKPKAPAGGDLEKEMKDLKAEVSELKSRMAKILEQLEGLAKEKR